MTRINIISENLKSTVVTYYEIKNIGQTSYQKEEQLENEFIKTLQGQAYEYLTFKSENELISNLRKQLEKLNKIEFSENEWDYLFKKILSNSNSGILEKTKMIQENHIQTIELDNGLTRNIYLIDKENVHNNYLQVINQYELEGNRKNIYDVTILVNGLPLIHIELKRRGVDIKEAFNQINRYQRDSFWSGSGLFEYIQVFVISNGTLTKYYSNTTRNFHINKGNKKTSNTFEFTSYWSDQKNRPILDLMDFTKTFFQKHTILNVLTKYCVFTSDDVLLVMRPYQIVATEKILNKITIGNNYKYFGTNKAGGFVWHTTGSGKTLTSFKTSRLASQLSFIDKVIFVVDRKDLDYQTMKEYDKFKKGAANSNASTKVLEEQLNDSNSKIIITTIQKLDNFIKKNDSSDVYLKQVVLIFDECHRSQFGEMHKKIIKKFKKYYLFGFTGTPIFAQNATTVKGISQTTEQVFGDKLHTYTIVDAINDKNVLPFRYEYVKTVDIGNIGSDEQIPAIDREKILANPERIGLIANYIVDKFPIKTKSSKSYEFNKLNNISEMASSKTVSEKKNKTNINGFNSIFAVSSIKMAKLYYEAFKSIPAHNLRIGLIYSYGANDEVEDGLVEENPELTDSLSKSDRDFLEGAIKDYNNYFQTNYDTSSEKFQNYYKDVSLRMKNKELDILIVANMFLTGFDATTLNTLWVDKNLKYHGLIQAFSRTNRILNSVKTFGNIVCFRDLEKELEDALSLFGDSETSSIVLLKTYNEYYYGYEENDKSFVGYQSLVEELKEKFDPLQRIEGEALKKEYIKLYGSILKARNILSTFDQFADDNLLTEREIQDYQSIYIDLHGEFNNKVNRDKVDVSDDVVFEMELIKQIEVNIDYIINLIQKYQDSNCKDKEVLLSVKKSIMASPQLRSKSELIEEFISKLDGNTDIENSLIEFMLMKKNEELTHIIVTEKLKETEAIEFMNRAFETGVFDAAGTQIAAIIPPISRFSKDNARTETKNRVISLLEELFNKYIDVISMS